MEHYLEAVFDGLLSDWLVGLQDVCRIHEPRKGVEGVVDAQVGCLQVWLYISLVHGIDCV